MTSASKSLRIHIVTTDEPFYINPLLAKLIPRIKTELVGITVLPPKPPKQTLRTYYTRLFTLFGVRNGFRLAWRLVKARVGERTGSRVALSKLIRKYHIPKVPSQSVNDPLFIEKIAQENVDIIISFCGEIFKKDIIGAPRIGVINKHCALLPEYKGVYPVFWALLADEKEVGITLHFMDVGIDTGPILAQEAIAVRPRDSFNSLYERLHALAPEMFVTVLGILREGQRPVVKARPGPGAYFSFPKREDVAAFHRKGKRLF